MEQRRKDELNRAAAEPAVWGSTMPEPKKAAPPARMVNEAKMARVAAMEGMAGALLSSVAASEGLEREEVPFWRVTCSTDVVFGDLAPEESERIIEDNNMCSFCLRHGMDQNCWGGGTD
jgi:hypothetical protein